MIFDIILGYIVVFTISFSLAIMYAPEGEEDKKGFHYK